MWVRPVPEVIRDPSPVPAGVRGRVTPRSRSDTGPIPRPRRCTGTISLPTVPLT
ncbi:hypothetical protein [Gracilinema caldarium]|uniref:hypothetical protein n=1 Tax=Gracilinema caldarium TaxID=215591 RepID=UPI0026EB6E28|nr:hypothetical protein [Gracilinema caldarium]